MAEAAPLLTRPFVLCFVSCFLHSIGLSLFFHVPGFLQGLGAGEAQIGLIVGAAAFVAIAIRPPLGRVMDSHGRSIVIRAGGVVHVVTCILYLTIDSLGVYVYGVRAMHGLAEAMLFAALFTYAADIVPAERRTEGIALFGLSGMLPIALGGLLGDAILAAGTYEAVFQVAGILAVAGLIVSLPLRDVPAAAGAVPARSFAGVLADRDLVSLWFVGTVFSIAIAAPFTFTKTFVLASGIGSLGLFLAAYSTAAIALRLTLAWLPDRVGPKRALAPALACLALGLGILGLAADATDVAIAGTLCGLGHGFTFPIVSGLVVTRSRANERGTAMAIFTALFDAGILVGGPGFGFIAEHRGYPAMFLTAAALVVIGTVAFYILDGRHPSMPDVDP